MRPWSWFVAALLALAVLPAPAHAAQVTMNGSQKLLSFRADPGEANRLSVGESGGKITFTDPGVPSWSITTAGTGTGSCSQVSGTVSCDGDSTFVIKVDLGDLDDTATVSADVGVRLSGGDGDDVLTGGNGADKLTGGAGADRLVGGPGADIFEGDDGRDVVDYSARLVPVTVTPGGGADDGPLGEGDDVDASVEGVIGGAGSDDLTATPGGGSLDGGPGDDRLHSADDAADTVTCGDGADAADADDLDTVAADCESVTRPPAPVARTADADPAAPAAPVVDDAPAAGAGDAPAAPAAPGPVTAAVAAGTVLVTAPGGRPHSLRPDEAIPAGALVDARSGAVTLSSGEGADGLPQNATFHDGSFRVHRDGAVTELELAGGGFASCPRTRGGARPRAIAARRPRTIRRLWGSGHGRFRTRGRYAAATVRGTIWLTEDRCDGTLVSVKRGVVAVRDRLRRKTVSVRAGRSYLARSPR